MMLLVLLLLSVYKRVHTHDSCVFISDNDNCHSGGACCLSDSVLALSKLLSHFLLMWALCGGNWLTPSWRSPCSEVLLLGQGPAPPLPTAPSHRSCCVTPALQGQTMSCDRCHHSLSSESHPHNTLESPENFRKMPGVIGSGGFFVCEKPLTLMGQPIYLPVDFGAAVMRRHFHVCYWGLLSKAVPLFTVFYRGSSLGYSK